MILLSCFFAAGGAGGLGGGGAELSPPFLIKPSLMVPPFSKMEFVLSELFFIFHLVYLY